MGICTDFCWILSLVEPTCLVVTFAAQRLWSCQSIYKVEQQGQELLSIFRGE